MPPVQVGYLLSGLFSRACRSLGNADKLGELQSEAASLRKVLVEKYRTVAVTLEGTFMRPRVVYYSNMADEDGNDSLVDSYVYFYIYRLQTCLFIIAVGDIA